MARQWFAAYRPGAATAGGAGENHPDQRRFAADPGGGREPGLIGRRIELNGVTKWAVHLIHHIERWVIRRSQSIRPGTYGLAHAGSNIKTQTAPLRFRAV